MAKFEGIGLACGDYPSKDIGEKIFGGENTLQQEMNVEAALARAQAKLGIIPAEAAEEITKKCDVSLLDEEEHRRQVEITNHPLVPLIRVYSDICDNGYGEYIHYGATSQDIADTALMLQLRQAYEIVEEKTAKLRNIIAEKAVANKSLVMMGRTNDQQALPITLGFKMASWVDELNRSIERLAASKKRIFVGQFAGAVGTLASLEDKGIEVQRLLMEELDLGVPEIAWYSSRDRLAEMVGNVSILTCSLGRFGNEVYNGQRSEVNELAEGFVNGRVGSSTMPHKRNPFVSGRLVGYARMSRGLMADMLTCMEATNERDCRTLFAENDVLAKTFLLADCALDTAINLFSNLEVHKNGIQRNLDLLGGLVFAEALMMRLSHEFGRLEAHEMIYQLAQKAIGEGKDFRTLLLQDPVIGEKISEDELNEIMKPEGYIGLSEYFVEKVCEKS
jgi:3-carboxy-cis,cis-muconate cycloisomerase